MFFQLFSCQEVEKHWIHPWKRPERVWGCILSHPGGVTRTLWLREQPGEHSKGWELLPSFSQSEQGRKEFLFRNRWERWDRPKQN